MPFPLIPLIGAGISAAGGILSTHLGNKSAERAYQRDRRDAQADWKQQNEYNSPKAQMERFKEAGLNPQLIYGQGTPGNASATPVQQQKSGAPTYKYNLQEIYGEAQRLALNMQQTQQTVENLKTNQELMATNIELQNQLKGIREKELPFKLDLKDAQIHSLNTQSTWRNRLLEPTLQNLNTRTQIATDKNAREERWLKSQLNINNYRGQQIQAQTALTIEQRALTTLKKVAQSNLNDYQKITLSEGLRKLQAETENIIQGRRTSMSVEQLNRINAELREWESTYKPVSQSVDILLRILSPFKKQGAY